MRKHPRTGRQCSETSHEDGRPLRAARTLGGGTFKRTKSDIVADLLRQMDLYRDLIRKQWREGEPPEPTLKTFIELLNATLEALKDAR